MPVSVSNPPAHVHLEPPGWVDFGTGQIPDALPIAHKSAFSHISLLDPSDHTLAIIAARLQPLLDRDGRWIEKLVGLAGRRPDLVAAAFGHFQPPAALIDLTLHPPAAEPSAAPVHNQEWSGSRLRQLREARGMSQADTANRVTNLDPAVPVTDDQIAKLEAGGHPRVAHLRARLDVAYRGDGRTICAAIPTVARPSDHTVTITPPPWWTGPIWLVPDAPPGAPTDTIILRWPPWQHRIRLHPHTPLATRKAPGMPKPLDIELPPQWTLTWGLGNHPHADTIFNR